MAYAIFESVCDHWRLLLGLFIAQGICGVLLFEWAWKIAERARGAEEAMWKEFPSFRRLDMHLWSRSKFYPGCFLMLVPRFMWIMWSVFMLGVTCKIIGYGKSMEVPMTGWRRDVHCWLGQFWSKMIVYGFGYRMVRTDHSEEDTDYSKYLGPDYRKTKF